jgi:DNA primase
MSHLEQFIKNCHNNILCNNAESNRAKDYLIDERGLTLETIKKHNIGYCNAYGKLPEEITFFGRDKKDGDKGFAYFIKGRLIVPVYNEFGESIAFATRKPSVEPGNTWWNCPYKKGNHLFLLDKARKSMFDNNKVYLVEGYMDALVLYQEGLHNVVGLMGVSISSRKMGLIIRYCNNICMCLDVDASEAGQKAQEEAICILKKFDFCESISVLDGMPVDKDPDIFVLENSLKELLSKERKLTVAEMAKIQKDVCKRRNRE